MDYFNIDDDGRFHGMDLTAVFNLVAPCPALSVPAGFNQEGLPVGLSLVGARGNDALLVATAHALAGDER